MLDLVHMNDDILWDSLLMASAQDNIYLRSNFLRWTNLSESRYLLFEDDKPLIGCLLPPRFNGNMNPSSYCMYQGAFFIEKIVNSYSDDNDRTRKLYKLASKISNNFSDLSLSFHHSISDIRGLEWFYYDSKSLDLLKTKVRYTGIINLHDFSNFEEYKKSLRKSRIQEINLFEERFAASIQINSNVNLFIALYREMFERKGLPVNEEHIERVSSIIRNALSEGFGRLMTVQDNQGSCMAGIFTLTDSKTDYYQFGATDINGRKFSASTYLMGKAIELAYDEDRRNFDMVGMNSPGRGEYKASFNARVKPYFDLQIGSI